LVTRWRRFPELIKLTEPDLAYLVHSLVKSSHIQL